MKILNTIKKMYFCEHLLFFVMLIFVLLRCSITKNSAISVLVGPSIGGAIENKEMSGIAGISKLDAITGATQTTYHAGVHSEIDVKGHIIETGIDYVRFKQSVGYNLPSFAITGNRDFQFHQMRLPLTYNFQFLKKHRSYPRLIVKAGLSLGYAFSRSVKDFGNMPDYKFTNWDIGPTLGVTVNLFKFKEVFLVGLYYDLCYGSKIYDDQYHQATGVGGLGLVKFGLTLQRSFLKL